LPIAVEQLLKGFLNLSFALGRRVPLFGKQVAVMVVLVSSMAVAGPAGNVAEGSVYVQRQRGPVSGLCLRGRAAHQRQ
jgi:hypothetical protein